MEPELERLVEAGKLNGAVAEGIDRLQPESFCLHRSWGVGQIDSWDLLGDQLIINFEDKPGHPMKLKFASNALEPIPDDHIMAQRFKDREGLQELAESDPVELLWRTVSSFGGSMDLDKVEDVLKGQIVPEGKYKSWWDSTKKKLRADRRFVVPAKRTLPLELRSEDISPADALVADVLETADLKGKAKAVEAILKDKGAFDNPKEELLPVVVHLNEAASKAMKMMPGQAIELILARRDLQNNFKELADHQNEFRLADILVNLRDDLGEVIRALGVSRQRQVLETFPQAFGDEWLHEVFQMFNTAGLRGIGELSKFLIDQGKEEEMVEFLKLGLQQRQLDSDVLAWVCKERKGKAAACITSDFPSAILNSLERDHFDDESRRSNRLAELLSDDRELVPDLVRDLEINTVRGFARRLLMSPVFDDLSRKSILARVVKLHPDIQDLITGGQEEKKEETLIVSWDSLEARKRDFDHLINVLIPQNKEEIKIARSYGDLRENFEYKAAKQQEAVLNRKRREMQRDLERARGTAFEDVDTSKVGIGTVVEIEDLDSGEKEKYTILGAWDSEPKKNVISYTTSAGEALSGKAEGEQAELPTDLEGQTRKVKVVSIQPYKS